jgi:peptide/nickel transport system substrate-binding protein
MVAVRTPLGLSALLLLLLAACGREEDGPISVSAVGGEPRLAEPNRAPLDPASALLVSSVAQGLVRFDAGGEIEPALAQRWIVSDDGRRYTFRLAQTEWRSGGKVTAQQVVTRLRGAAAPTSHNSLKPILGAIEEIVAMTDEVLEISLKSPRPNFLHLLAQPEMAILRAGEGTGPYRAERSPDGAIKLSLRPPVDPAEADQEEPAETRPILLRGERAALAVARFKAGETDLVLGGGVGDLPVARAARASATALRFDPANGLLGLVFERADGPFARADIRQALAMAIDRPALTAALAVPNLQPRESLLPPGVEGLTTVSAPAWIHAPLTERRGAARRALGALAAPLAVRVAMPQGPGYRLVFAHLRRDWAAIGVRAQRVPSAQAADLRIVDEVAPAALASWYLRRFSCEASRVCDPAADEMMAAARLAPDAATRRGLLANADRILAGLGPFIPLAAPVRWSLVSPRLTGFRQNGSARHPLGELIAPVK